MKYLLATCFAFLLFNTGFSQTYEGKQKHIDRILENIAQFSEYVMAGDSENIGAAYTEDAKIFPNNTDIIAGRVKITNYWKPSGEASVSYHKIIPSEIKIIGKEAYDYGYYEGKTLLADGKEISWRGKYVIIWKRVDGDWKIYLDIWNQIKD
ncbi:MAG: YybH family protein [Lewinella sp.]|uniref:YybH family protein n=1 Tax=Lewinella sp. TaxID=2004506 RepID=UPI003D6B3CFD